jgi:F-type H+-transporting ATPase subunit a
MVISNKPLRFIIAILIACLPIFGFANTEAESTPVQTETTAVAHEAAPE